MDGVFVAFHNTARTFGFQYIPLEEMDRSLFGNSFMGDQSFLISLKLLNEILDTATSGFPNKVRVYHMFVYKTFIQIIIVVILNFIILSLLYLNSHVRHSA